MTLDSLIKKLEKLRKKFGGRVRVTANARGMLSACNGVFDIMEVKTAEYAVIETVDGDGFVVYNKDNTGRVQKCIVLGYYLLGETHD